MQYSETLQQIERSETFDRLYILIVLIAVSVVLAVTLCLAVFRKKTPFKLPLVVFVILLCVIGAYIFQNVSSPKSARISKRKTTLLTSGISKSGISLPERKPPPF